MEEAIRKQLEGAFDVMNKNTTEITSQITMSPSDVFGVKSWDNMLNLGAGVIMPFAITILCFLIAMEFYNVYCRHNGQLDLELVATTSVKFVLPMILINRVYDLIKIIFIAFNELIINMNKYFTASENAFEQTKMIDEIMKTVEKMNFWEKCSYWLEVSMTSWGVEIMGVIIFVLIYLRIFEIVILWILSPIPSVTLVSSGEFSQIGKNFYKMFMGVMLQGGVMYLVVYIYNQVIKSNAFDPTSFSMFNMIKFFAILTVTLCTSGKISKRILGTF